MAQERAGAFLGGGSSFALLAILKGCQNSRVFAKADEFPRKISLTPFYFGGSQVASRQLRFRGGILGRLKKGRGLFSGHGSSFALSALATSKGSQNSRVFAQAYVPEADIPDAALLRRRKSREPSIMISACIAATGRRGADEAPLRLST